jgi:Cu2+-exporting ATPase
MSETVDLSPFVRKLPDGTARLDLVVDGMTCAACIGDIEGALGKTPGIVHARVNYTDRRLTVDWQDDETNPGSILEGLRNLGYSAYPFRGNDMEDAESRESKRLLRCLGVAGFAAMNIMLLSVAVWSGDVSGMDGATRDFLHWVSALLVIPAAAYAGRPFFGSALQALRRGGVNMDVPISLGITLALGMSIVETALHAQHAYFDSAIMLIFFLLTGRYLDHAMRRRTRSFAANLAALRTPTATRIAESGEVVSVPAEVLVRGDTILSRAGERIPIDGVVLSGRSEIDEGLVTGETRRRHVGEGDLIHAGSLNFSGTLRIEVTRAIGNTSLDDMQRLIENAVAAKSRYMRLGDRAARMYAPVVHSAALLTAMGWMWHGASFHDAVVTAIAVLIITCPCALALAVPAVQVVASGALFRRGILLNAGDGIERLSEIDTVVFDKTGTLTLPDVTVTNAATVDPDMLERAARLALSSHHPLARPVAACATLRRPFDHVTEVAGSGVQGLLQGQDMRLGSAAFCDLESEAEAARAADPDASIICFRHGTRGIVLRVRQALRSDAAHTVATLRDLGFRLAILSGDRTGPVLQVARALGIEDAHAQMKPADKTAFLEDLASRGQKVLMVGDGINDAPALASAHVSLSPITASDLAQNAADAVFMGDALSPVVMAITLSRRARQLMRQNLWLAVIYNVIAVPMAMLGHVTPLIAAAAMSGSSILVTLNALRAGGLTARRTATSAVTQSPPLSLVKP